MRAKALLAVIALLSSHALTAEPVPKPILDASARGMIAYKPMIAALLPDVVSAVTHTPGGLSGGGVVGGDLLLWTGVDINLSSTGVINWSSTALPSGTKDVGFSRPSSGLIKVTNGGTGLGVFQTGKLTLTALGTPAAPVITQGGAGGATAYSYKIVAKLPDTTTTQSGNAGSTATGNAALDGTNYNIITWAATTNAHCYDVYRTVGGATLGKIATCTTSPLNDTGLAGDASTAPDTNSTGLINGGSIAGYGNTTVCASPILLSNCAAFPHSVHIGYGSSVAGGGYAVAIGRSANATSYSVALGYSAIASGANQFVSGSDGYPISNVYFGDGVASSTPPAYTINGTGGSGTDIVGGDLQLAPGISTGLAVPGKVKIRNSRVIGTGPTAQTLADLAYFGDVAADGSTNFFNVTGTLPTSSSAPTAGVKFDITGAAGASVQAEYGLYATLAGGAASPTYSYAGYFYNSNTGLGHTGVLGIGPSGSHGGAFFVNDISGLGYSTASGLVAGNSNQAVDIFQGLDYQTLVYRIIDSGAVWAKTCEKALVSATPTEFVQITMPASGRQGGMLEYCVDANDATNYQTRCGIIPFTFINEASTEACTVGTTSDSDGTPTGTLTAAITTASAANNTCGLLANADSSLAETTLRINAHIRLLGNAATAVACQ